MRVSMVSEIEMTIPNIVIKSEKKEEPEKTGNIELLELFNKDPMIATEESRNKKKALRETKVP